METQQQPSSSLFMRLTPSPLQPLSFLLFFFVVRVSFRLAQLLRAFFFDPVRPRSWDTPLSTESYRAQHSSCAVCVLPNTVYCLLLPFFWR
jgi:hypothetical protein